MTHNKKLKLNRESSAPLKMFFFTVQPANDPVVVKMDVQGIMAYDVANAMEETRHRYHKDAQIRIVHRGHLLVEQVINGLDLNTSIKSPIQEIQTSKQQFVNNCLYITDKFINEKRDQTSIKRILGKIKLDEPKRIPVTNKDK